MSGCWLHDIPRVGSTNTLQNGGIMIHRAMDQATISPNNTFERINRLGIRIGKNEPVRDKYIQDVTIKNNDFEEIWGDANQTWVTAILTFGDNIVVEFNTVDHVYSAADATEAEGIYTKAGPAMIRGNTLIDAGGDE